MVLSAAGSEPTSFSVSANAETAPLARRGRYFFFWAGVPNSLSGVGHADRLGRGEQRREVAVLAGHQSDRVGVAVLAQPQAAVLGRDLDAEGADVAQLLHELGRNLPVAVDLVAIHPLLHEALELVHERLGAREIRRIGLGEGMHQVEPERALEQLAHEAGRFPLLLARRLGDFAGLLLGGQRSMRRPLGTAENVSHGSNARLRLW